MSESQFLIEERNQKLSTEMVFILGESMIKGI